MLIFNVRIMWEKIGSLYLTILDVCVKTKLITCKCASTTGHTGIRNLFFHWRKEYVFPRMLPSLCCIKVFLQKNFSCYQPDTYTEKSILVSPVMQVTTSWFRGYPGVSLD